MKEEQKEVAPSDAREQVKTATYKQLMWRRFKKHKLAMIGLVVLILLYASALFCEPLAPYGKATTGNCIGAPPQRPRFVGKDGIHIRPFVYGYKQSIDGENLMRLFELDTDRAYPIRFLVHGDEYKLWGLIKCDLHLFGVERDLHGTEEPGTIFLFGTDRLGRCVFSRLWYGARITLSVGLLGVLVSFLLGVTLGGISGYYGGWIDSVIQRVIVFLVAVPKLPLWMALAAALPDKMEPFLMYLAITLILSVMGWCGLARQVRGKILQLRDQDFITAARLANGSDRWIISRHLLPSLASHMIVSITLAIPAMIMGETALSFLGLGMQPPALSLGTLLQDAQGVRTLAVAPWLLLPGLFVVLAVTSFNFVGDGLRDAADPYGK